MGHSKKSMKDSGVKSNVDNESPAHEIPEEKNTSKYLRDNSCSILAKNMTAVCPCSTYLPEAKLKSLGLMALSEEISR